jgi:serine/threonine protein kinase
MGIFRKVLAGCLAITQNCVIHRDLKPANIIVSPALDAKIIDFGFCEVIRAKKVMRTFNVGSPSYMAPEAYLRTLYSEKSDSWSLGMILFEMLHGRTLDEGQNIKDYFEVLKNNPNYLSQFTGSFTENVREILEKSLKYLPEDRMSISSMKYAADLYHIRRTRQEQPSFTSTQPSFRAVKPPQIPKPPTPQTLHNISGEMINCTSRDGFISFADFSKPGQGRHNKASQISLSSSSNKNSSVQYSMGGRTNENYQFLANKLPLEAYQSLSSKDIIERRPRGPPAFRQVTVRYL